MLRLLAALLLTLVSGHSWAEVPDWSNGAIVPKEGRANPYLLSEQEYANAIRKGLLHTLHYPVTVTGSLLPYRPINRYFKNLDPITKWMGLHTYPKSEASGPYFVPFENGIRPAQRMGLTLLETQHGQAVTFSCTTCHSANLFGRKIIGLSNRFPRANEAFVLVESVLKKQNLPAFQLLTGASNSEMELLKRTVKNLKSVESVKPQALGLDTSLAHVALSMSRRAQDAYASFDKKFQKNPRAEILRDTPADSKPAVWWTLKYKNRWLSDGSLISGNPIFTNFIWNEIGRGTDLKELEDWLAQNSETVQELTTAVFASEPPPITDFFPAERIDLATAKKGQTLFLNACSACHGVYEKNWDRLEMNSFSEADLLKTFWVRYPRQTSVVDVGTDPKRYEGMNSLAAALNPLSISKENGILIEPQRGYVPPPLVGIWARWPYFHNNSAPSLCAVLTPPTQRPKRYYAGEALDPNRDFDFDCNGYPSGSKIPLQWKIEGKGFYDTKKAGMSNAGHSVGPFTSEERHQLIQFLQTL